jgi:hypothetical protein
LNLLTLDGTVGPLAIPLIYLMDAAYALRKIIIAPRP